MKIYLGYQLETDGTEVVKIFVLGRRAARSLLGVSLLHPTSPPLLSNLIVVSITLISISIMYYHTNLFCSAPLHSWLIPPSPLFSHRFTALCLSLIKLFYSH